MSAPEILVRVVKEDALRSELTVRVRDGSGESKHEVTLARDMVQRLAAGEPAESFVRRCFVFLLERESKESILRHFDVSVISKYFPEFERTIAVK